MVTFLYMHNKLLTVLKHRKHRRISKSTISVKVNKVFCTDVSVKNLSPTNPRVGNKEICTIKENYSQLEACVKCLTDIW